VKLDALARFARARIAEELGGEPASRDELDASCNQWGASFVTLRWDDGRLQGCIGSLEPRKYADLAVLSDDFLTVPDDALPKIRALLTMVGGNVVYAAPPFAGLEPPTPKYPWYGVSGVRPFHEIAAQTTVGVYCTFSFIPRS